ncbi:Bug family tripartite tricarboxylate transporter substrate binding protein [Hydrogenophaga sp. BPS33]|uniref:Bug family tripartite tricarboxylate transporter substrate binding protein n=1 Tax=Hydrogenophaga sp. BPS33 TaxID=2651974 RepID=UPI00135BB5CE|nr:tripartite tricarboxylate transporter substrate binding protein [Hydrogenophaga sp. BPS33]
MNKLLPRLLLALCAVATAGLANAQAFPNKPIRWISPWAPAGGNDVLSRAIGNEISKSLGQPVVVENKPGASGTMGTDQVAKAPADGYTLTLGSPGTHATALSMVPGLPYDPVKSFTPIVLVGTVPNVLVVPTSVPANSVKELIAYLKAHPNSYNFASVGNGSMQHLAGELFKRMAGVEITHVAYKGSAPALLDLTGGRVEMAFESMPTVLPLVRGGKLKALAVTTPKRSSLMPEVPTIAESGLPGFDVTVWYGVFGPAGMPADVTTKLNQSINAALRTPELGQRLSELGADVAGGTAQDLARYQAAESTKWNKFIKDAGIAP